MALRTPNSLYGLVDFVGAGAAEDFVCGIRQGEFLFVLPNLSVLKILRILRRIQQSVKNTEKKKQFDPRPDLREVGPDLA